MDWRDFPLPDGSYSDDCRPFTQQDVCNYLPTFAEAQGARSRVKYVPVPGLVTFANVGNGPHRGSRDVEGKLFVVSGNTLYQVSTNGTATSRGTIPGTRRVSMVHNQIDGGNELIIATGDNSYVWNTVTETLTATGVPLLFVDFLNQMIVGIDVARRFWRWSGLADATSWNMLDNESAESSPDRLVGHIVSQGEVLLFGERTIEVWSNAPSGNLTFQRSTVIEKGCANGHTICRLDNTVYFVGNDSIAYRMQGYTPVPISSKAITDAISDGDPSKLFAFTWEDKGYVVYYLTAQDGNTWGFDVTCQKWHRRESFGLDRWRVNTLCKWNGDWYAGDYANGKLYRLTWGNVYEGCDIMPRTLRTGVMHNNGNRMFISALKLLVNTGREPSVASGIPAITGDLPDGFVGDVVDYQYTVTPAYPGQTVTLTLTGALPTGLAMDAAGHVTGTLTTGGTFSWTITPSSECGDGVALEDAATVTEIPWFTASTTGIVASPEGMDWTAAPAVQAGVWMFSGGGKVVNVRSGDTGSTGATTSDEGAVWVPHTGLSAQTCTQGVYVNGWYLICANGRVVNRGTDGIAYTPVTIGSGVLNTNLAAISASPTAVLVGGSEDLNTKNVAISLDNGATFPTSAMAFTGAGSRDVLSIANNGTRFVAVGSTNRMAYTDNNGASWVQIASPFAGTNSIVFVGYGGGRWVAANNQGEIAYSDDAVTWTLSASTLGSTATLIDAEYSGGRWVMAGGLKMIASTDNAVTWAAVTHNQTGTIRGIARLTP